MPFPKFVFIGLLSFSCLVHAQDSAAPSQPRVRRVQIKIAPPPDIERPDTNYHPVKIRGGYAVVVSKATHEQPGWKQVVEKLKEKYEAEVVVYESSVEQACEKLAQLMPRFTCFVATPEEAGRRFVVTVHRMTRRLDDDPYTDTLWGIVTGIDDRAALRHVMTTEPLTVRRALGTTGVPLDRFEKGLVISDGGKGQVHRRNVSEQEIAAQPGAAADRAKVFVDAMHRLPPDLLVTSWHATERDLQMPLSRTSGQIRCSKGRLFGLSATEPKGWAILSPNPKVHLAAGNCLLGRIDGKEAMALALMHSGGVNQLVGYVVSTWFGRGGWGVLSWFYSGRFSAAEAWYINCQTLVHELRTRYPQTADFKIDQWNMETDRGLLGRLAKKLGYAKPDPKIKNHLGLLWDRDTVALYGDPAWRAVMPADPQPGYTQKLDHRANAFSLKIDMHKDRARADFFAFLPHRIDPGTLKITAGETYTPVITDNFILLRGVKDLKADQTLWIRFTALPAKRQG